MCENIIEFEDGYSNITGSILFKLICRNCRKPNEEENETVVIKNYDHVVYQMATMPCCYEKSINEEGKMVYKRVN